jgi:ABC-type multidrug transport system fused ATPase/permease subunit
MTPTGAPILHRYRLYARLLWTASPLLTLLSLLATLCTALANTAVIVTTGHLIGELSGGDGIGDAWWWFWATIGTFLAGPLLLTVSSAIGEAVAARYLVLVYDLAMEAGTGPSDLETLEDPVRAGRYKALANAMRDPLFVMGIEATWRVIYIRLSGVGALVLLLVWRWWAAVILVASYIYLSRKFTGWLNTVHDDVLTTTATGRRRAAYLRSLLVDPSVGKEIRLFGLRDWLLDRYVQSWRSTLSVIWESRNQNLKSILWATVLGLAANALVFGLLARDSWLGAISVATLVSLVQAIIALDAFGPVGDQQSAIASQTSTVTELSALRSDLGLAGLSRTTPPEVSASAAGRSRRTAVSVDIDHLSFTYPGSQTTVLSGVQLHIPAGQSTALVGLNGAGKSTLIKLLCGLHQPDEGTIRLNAADTANSRVGVVFQNFTHYHLSLRDNVAVGAGGRAWSQAELEQALDDAGAGDLPSQLPQGWDTVLSPEYSNGADLSGGQWQRVALARALMALSVGAGLLILDEPTASLDVRAEAELFDRFLDVTRGATTLLVSHRLSSVRHADRILVLGQRPEDRTTGIVEDGSHQELLERGGIYAELFRLQASHFNLTGDRRVP